MWSRVYENVERPSVCPSVCLSHQYIETTAAAGLPLRALLEDDIIDSRRRRSAPTAPAVPAAGCSTATAPQHGAQQQMRAVAR